MQCGKKDAFKDTGDSEEFAIESLLDKEYMAVRKLDTKLSLNGRFSQGFTTIQYQETSKGFVYSCCLNFCSINNF